MNRVACPLCGGWAKSQLVASDRNRALSLERFEYRRCVNCRTSFLANVPDDLAAYYPQQYYDLPADQQRTQLLDSERHKLRVLLELVEPGPMIEIGPAYGLFAGVAKEAGFHVTGIEMDTRSCEYLERTIGITAINSDRPQDVLGDQPASRAIVLWHVLEHLLEPWAVLERAVDSLEPEGVLALSTPNPRSLQFRLVRTRWAHLDAPRHVVLVPPRTLIDRLTALGLRCERLTTSDPAGLMANHLGWEYAMLRNPATQPPTRLTSTLALAAERTLGPVERRGRNGSTYTAFFVKRG